MDASSGALNFVPLDFRSTDGVLVSLRLKTILWSADSTRFWEIRNVLHRVLFRRSSLDVARFIARELSPFFDEFEHFGLAMLVDFKPSLRSAQSRSDDSYAEDSKVRHCAMLSTAAFVLLLLHLREKRRCADERECCRMLLNTLIAEIADRDSCIEFLDDASILARQVVGDCGDSVGGQPCIHMLNSWCSPEAVPDDHGACVASRLFVAYGARDTCGAMGHTLAPMLSGLAVLLDECVPRHEYPDDPLEVSLLRGKKRLLAVDEDFSQAMSAAVHAGRAPHCAALARSTLKIGVKSASNFSGRQLCLVQASAHLTFAVGGDLSVALDASRVGNPAVETMVLAAYSTVADRGVALPPQDFLAEQQKAYNKRVVECMWRFFALAPCRETKTTHNAMQGFFSTVFLQFTYNITTISLQ
jgi:hypothetical protein